MRRINKFSQLKEGDYVLWKNGGEKRLDFGKVIKIEEGSIFTNLITLEGKNKGLFLKDEILFISTRIGSDWKLYILTKKEAIKYKDKELLVCL